jgi:hypothetical protein
MIDRIAYINEHETILPNYCFTQIVACQLITKPIQELLPFLDYVSNKKNLDLEKHEDFELSCCLLIDLVNYN